MKPIDLNQPKQSNAPITINVDRDTLDRQWMQRALGLARQGAGKVEPNPMVGCVVIRQGQIIGEGFHRRFGGPHAEVDALQPLLAANVPLNDATVYVTLEPCSHTGKTPPCADALITAGVQRVVIAHLDPSSPVNGSGAARLRQAGIAVDVGCLQTQAAEVLAPFLKVATQRLPWVIAKWAMSLDGKIATASGNSQWISNPRSRQVVQQLRGRVDAIVVGSRTAHVDDPLLTARPESEHDVLRRATRIVVDSQAGLSLESQLVRTAKQFPTLIAVGPSASPDKLDSLQQTGCEIWQSRSTDHLCRLNELLTFLASQGMTNLLVEGGGGLLGGLNDLGQIDETHVFIAPKILGGAAAVTPLAGIGVSSVADGAPIRIINSQVLDGDLYLTARRNR